MITKAIIAAASAAAAALTTAAVAAADTDSIINIGDDNLGVTVGTTGGSVALAGYRTTVDGINTLTGSTTIVGPHWDSAIVQKYSLQGVETAGHITTPHVTFTGQGEIYYNGETEGEFTTNGYTLVCNPLCHHEQ